ncbi:MAG: ferritin family protein [Firmicutes bacterium]|nr:ferritin family protein [Bacillota bacterium]
MEQNILPAQGNTSYAQALEIAIEREIKARFMYKSIAKHATSSHMKTKLEFLAEEEQDHRENLEDLYKKITGTPKDFESAIIFPDEADAANYAQLEITEIIAVAIEKEEEANKFYTEMAEKADEGALKDLFSYLAEEELTHKRMMQLELKLYTGATPLSRPVETIPGVYRDWW